MSILAPLKTLFCPSGDVSSGFSKPELAAIFIPGRGIHDIRSLRFTFAGVYGQHSSQLIFPHMCFSRGGMPDLNCRPPAWQSDVLTTRPQRPGRKHGIYMATGGHLFMSHFTKDQGGGTPWSTLFPCIFTTVHLFL